MDIYEVCAAMTVISALVSCGFSIETVVAANKKRDGSLITAQYALSRSVSIAVVALTVFIFKSNAFLIAMSVIMIGIQFFDGWIGTKVSRLKTVGPNITAIANAIVLAVFLMA